MTSGSWDTKEMASALEGVATQDFAETKNGVEDNNSKHQDAQECGWTKPQAYDYDSFNERGGSWESSVAVYEWDGEEGDLGPEMPHLEQQLFGNSKTTAPTGIDFSK